MTDATQPDDPRDDELLAILASGTPVGTPSDELRERVLRLGTQRQFVFIERAQGIWLPGLDAPAATKELYCDSKDRLATRLVRLEAGAALPSAALTGDRSIIVVAGVLLSGDERLAAGDCEHGATTPWVAAEPSLVLDLSTAAARGGSRLVIRGAELPWVSQADGIRVQPMITPGKQALFRLSAEPNATLTEHEHAGVEELFIVRGSCSVEGHVLHVGDYHRASQGSEHGLARTGALGCELVCSVRPLAEH